MIKQAFDFIMAIIGILLTAPIMVFLIIWIKIDSGGPVFYNPYRAGKHGRPFKIYKFRTMVMNADKLGGPTTAKNDPRITRSGKFIRKYKLDEIAQLLNVVRGEMSLVGPRPEVVWKVNKYSKEERKILELKPGITDWASIWNSDEGGVLANVADPDSVYESVVRPQKIELQLQYYHTRTFAKDIKIIISTIYRLINKDWTPKEIAGAPDFKQLRKMAIIFDENRE